MVNLVPLIFVQLTQVSWMSASPVALSINPRGISQQRPLVECFSSVDETDNARRSPNDHEHLPFVQYPGDDTENNELEARALSFHPRGSDVAYSRCKPFAQDPEQ
ncbi:hypothetical protein DFH06DRAFT_1195517 [Mycena polygramma]|nr:hypothetical protein DFH06DRAFT_1195517 [Mycena polygramma]